MAAKKKTTAAAEEEEEERTMEELLVLPIAICDSLQDAARSAHSFKVECSHLSDHAADLSNKLRSLVPLFLPSSSASYDRPVRRIAAEATKRLERALALAHRCRHSGVLRRLVTITSLADFHKTLALLDATAGDLRWLFSLFAGNDAAVDLLTLPPIASGDPILGWVWSLIAVVQMSPAATERADAAASLATLAAGEEPYRKAIVDEGGVPPLLRLLKESASPAAQIAAATALTHLATTPDRVRTIAAAVPVVVGVLSVSASAKVQAQVAALVSNMAALDCEAREAFGQENAVRLLVAVLSSTPAAAAAVTQHRQELKIKFVEALWKLAMDGNVLNSRRIVDVKGLPCLAGLVEKETGELRFNCVMALSEICAAAEKDAEFRRIAFKTSSPATKMVVGQLLAVAGGVAGDMELRSHAVRSIGSLAQTFPARETRVVKILVEGLSHRELKVAVEAAIALAKFISINNYNRVEHSKSIIEFNGVTPLMRLVRSGGTAQVHGLVTACWLAFNVPNSKALELAGALKELEWAWGAPLLQHHPWLKDLLLPAIQNLEAFRSGLLPFHRQM